MAFGEELSPPDIDDSPFCSNANTNESRNLVQASTSSFNMATGKHPQIDVPMRKSWSKILFDRIVSRCYRFACNNTLHASSVPQSEEETYPSNNDNGRKFSAVLAALNTNDNSSKNNNISSKSTRRHTRKMMTSSRAISNNNNNKMMVNNDNNSGNSNYSASNPNKDFIDDGSPNDNNVSATLDRERPSPSCRPCAQMKEWYVKFRKKADDSAGHSPKANLNGHGSRKKIPARAILTGPSTEVPMDIAENSFPTDCPLDKDELGRSTWGLLHTMAVHYPDNPTTEDMEDMINFLVLFAKFYPCTYCAAGFRKLIKKNHPDVESGYALSQWLCKMHNEVNKHVGKPQFDCDLEYQRWRDGWKDGRCDP